MKGKTGSKPIEYVEVAKPQPGVPMNSTESVAGIKKHGGKVNGKKSKMRADKRARGGGIHIKPENKGKLHKELGVPAGEKIPAKKLAKAKNSSDPAERKRATFAANAKKWNKG